MNSAGWIDLIALMLGFVFLGLAFGWGAAFGITCLVYFHKQAR